MSFPMIYKTEKARKAAMQAEIERARRCGDSVMCCGFYGKCQMAEIACIHRITEHESPQ
jgi:hypothetical protein